MFDRLKKQPIIRTHNALVAQLDRVLGYEPSGRRFESSRVHQTEKPTDFSGFFFAVTKVQLSALAKPARLERNPIGAICVIRLC